MVCAQKLYRLGGSEVLLYSVGTVMNLNTYRFKILAFCLEEKPSVIVLICVNYWLCQMHIYTITVCIRYGCV